MPSVASLEHQQYYAKPQNAFWRIMGVLFGAGPELDYVDRTARLIDAGIAVWDVLASCIRPGSLDAAIDMKTVQVNDLSQLVQDCPTIEAIFFNGRKAEQLYRRHAEVAVRSVKSHLNLHSLPSTSPAMATLNFEAKLAQWTLVKDTIEDASGR